MKIGTGISVCGSRYFHPLELQGGGGLQGLYDVWQSQMAVEQGAFTTPVTDGSDFGRWGDQTTNARHLAASADTNTQKPIWDAVYRGRSHGGVKFNTTTDDLVLVESPIFGISATAPAPFTVFWAGAIDSMDTDRSLWGFKHSSGNQLVLCQCLGAPGTNDRPRHLFRRNDNTGNADCLSEVGNFNTAFSLLTYVYDGNLQRLYQNGILIAELDGGEDGNNTLSTFCLGGTWDGTTQLGHWFGWVFAVAVFNVAISDAHRRMLDGYYSGRLGLSYSNATSARKTIIFGDSHTYRDFSEQPDFLAWPGKLQAALPHPDNSQFCNRGRTGKHLTGAGAHNGATAPDIDTMFANADTHIDTEWAIWLGPCDGNCARSDVLTEGGTDQQDADAHVATVLWPAAKALIDAMIAKTPRVGVMDTSPLRDPTEAAHRRNIVDQMNVLKRNYIKRFARGTHAPTWATLTGGSGDGLSVTYQKAADTLHLNDAGTTVQGDAAREAERHWDYYPGDHADLILWISGCDQDVALADGDPVGTVAAIIGDDGTAGAGVEPTFQLGEAAFNYRPTLRFDGSNDAVTLGAPLSLSSGEWTFVIVAHPDDYDSINPIFGRNSSNEGVSLLSSTTTAVALPNTGLLTFTHAARAAGDVIIITSEKRLWLNGVEATLSGDTSSTTVMTIDRLGATGAFRFDGDYAEGLIFNIPCPVSDLNSLGQHFARKYGKTWTPVT